MWKWLWTEHRSRLYAAAGAFLFLLSGMTVTFLSPEHSSGGGESLSLNERKPEPAYRKKIPASGVEQNKKDEGNAPAQAEPIPEPRAEWYLYITGSVRKPGVYQLPPDSRLFQLVDAAGGFDGLADRVAVNLAERLVDGQHVHVPSKSESRAAAKREEPQNRGTMILVEGPASPSSGWGFQASGSHQSNGLIDINHAPEGDLARLRGIGPTLARRIVEYRRQHGPFRSIEELVQVRGIGAAKVNGLRGQAKVSP